ncbi:unnamed protein product [Phaedon cochleariae]|uniref:Rho-GAP domain-containing protein n=1 Tax=Phaedon cochleariae TaxID=80249 RepID=A0A9P0DKD2_PHACE|nr:unnamed protein product [Phaedon cochleariae]
MDFDSPDVMKDFPGLYASELNKKCNNESDYSDDTEKGVKKDILIGKRKDKKDKKDKERGYAALEGESSDEGSKSRFKIIFRSPSKSKKSKSFKFTTKSKEKRDKSRDKDVSDKRKDKEKKIDKKFEKDKGKKVKQPIEETIDIAEVLPVFGVNLELSVQRSRCHDGVDIPVPIRDCIDYVEAVGIAFEGVYKISGTKTKVSQIRKMYNNRQTVKLSDYDVPTATSLLKMFLRDLPEPIFTNDLLIRFEEAGAILNLNTREKHLKILVEHLPFLNRLLLSWLIVHLHNISLNEKQNKMSKQSISAALNHTFHISSRLLQALLHHSQALFPDVVIFKYIPPLNSGAQLPENSCLLESELKKQESLLTQIHKEMNVGCISKEREEKLWEVQRIITQLKRRLKIVQRVQETHEKSDERISNEEEREVESMQKITEETVVISDSNMKESEDSISVKSVHSAAALDPIPEPEPSPQKEEISKIQALKESDCSEEELKNDFLFDDDIVLLTYKRNGLTHLKEQLIREMNSERREIESLKSQMSDTCTTGASSSKQTIPKQECLDEVMSLLHRENQILQIKKINLVREIIEQKELCIELSAQLRLAANDKYSNF